MTRRYIVRGRVQGVGFRAFVQRRGSELGLFGWVRNCDDGSVETLATGNPSQISEFAGYLHQGPLMADVRSVEEFEATPVAGPRFRIRY